MSQSYRQPRREHAAYLVRQDDRSVWKPDAAIRVNFSPTFQITDHPVEQGVTVSDHIQRQPQSITLDVVVTENPTKVGRMLGGRVYVREALRWLQETAEAGRLVDVYAPRLGVFVGYGIAGFPHALDNVARLAFQLTLREVRIASARTVLISVEDVAGAGDTATEAGAPDEVDVGEQPTTSTADEPEAEDSDTSLLASLLDAL